ncbi:TolB family protein [Naasia lichenicola]|uniref:Biopolymer transporter Tol n=1 Tax=Naasia lichenicola TaxID=2565933 RepID=A0A4S4FGY6_9MICO|nr:PD40 domain-containing protein [Naasia lichenicola]THG29278.1 biopolymer transporter Tol [Naasia lichenicola]
MDYRELGPGQISRLWIADLSDHDPEVVFESADMLIEAPNWTLDGSALIVNGNGALWRLDLEDRLLVQIPFEGLPPINNDHVLHPNGEDVFLSAVDGQIYRGSLRGGAVTRVTGDGPPELHFLHGVSPDGETLAYVGVEPEGGDMWARANIFTTPAAGGADRRLTDTESPADGPEYSPDGEWIYFNTEQFGEVSGHAQIARMRPDGSSLEQLTDDDGVNWFPHWAPDGRTAVYLRYPQGTRGHPADLEVELELVEGADWTAPRTRARVFGGQGTINVNSWAPTSDRFAYVEYPIALPV